MRSERLGSHTTPEEDAEIEQQKALIAQARQMSGPALPAGEGGGPSILRSLDRSFDPDPLVGALLELLPVSPFPEYTNIFGKISSKMCRRFF